MKPIFLIVCILFLSSSLYSQETNPGVDKMETKTISDSIMKLVKEEKLKEAFTIIKKHWPLPESEIDILEYQTTSQLEQVKVRFGSSLEYVLIDQKEIKDTFIKYVYVIKYERHITRWEFIFYKPKTKWILNTFKWDDDMGKLFQ